MLVKHTVDDFVLDEALEGVTIPPRLLALLKQDFQDEKTAKAALKAFRAAMPTGGDDDLILEELEEICTDLKWAKTRRGKLILMVNEVGPRLYVTIRGQWGLSDVMIGTHLKKPAVMVAGNVPTLNDKQRVLALVRSAFDVPVIDALVQKGG